MKKKILFVIPSLRSGGAEKSLISVLSLFDYNKYEVDLLLFRRDGLFLEKLPKEINYIYDTSDYEAFDGNGKEAVKYFVDKFKFSAALDRIKYTKAFSEKDEDMLNEKLWFFLEKRLPKIKKKYDCAIGYLEGNANSFVTHDVDASRKICYVHSDIKKLPYNEKSFRDSFEKCDAVVAVSEICAESLRHDFPDLSDKICVIENITSKKLIERDIDEKVFNRAEGETTILTVGRCAPPKNIGLAVDACRELKDRGRKIRWYHIGNGELEENVRMHVSEQGVEDCFVMLGERSNPYPYMAQCDIYVQPSIYEGKSIALDEVKCLCKPIVVTNFPSVTDQFTDNKTALVCNMDKDDMADKIEMLLDNKILAEKLTDNLRIEDFGNEEEIQKLYDLIEG